MMKPGTTLVPWATIQVWETCSDRLPVVSNFCDNQKSKWNTHTHTRLGEHYFGGLLLRFKVVCGFAYSVAFECKMYMQWGWCFFFLRIFFLTNIHNYLHLYCLAIYTHYLNFLHSFLIIDFTCRRLQSGHSKACSFWHNLVRDCFLGFNYVFVLFTGIPSKTALLGTGLLSAISGKRSFKGQWFLFLF